MSARIPNGTVLTTHDELMELVGWVTTAVVIDRDDVPWLVFETEDGDDCAITVPCPDGDIPARADFDGLCARGPLRVVFNGASVWADANPRQEASA